MIGTSWTAQPRKPLLVEHLVQGHRLLDNTNMIPPELEALGPAGCPVISDIAHLRRARTNDPDEAMFRRSFNYDEQPTTSGNEMYGETGISESGLIFVAFQCDVAQQYTPIQDR